MSISIRISKPRVLIIAFFFSLSLWPVADISTSGTFSQSVSTLCLYALNITVT